MTNGEFALNAFVTICELRRPSLWRRRIPGKSQTVSEWFPVKVSKLLTTIPIRLNHPELGIRVVVEPTAEVRIGWYHLELCFPPEGVVDLVVNISFGRNGAILAPPSGSGSKPFFR